MQSTPRPIFLSGAAPALVALVALLPAAARADVRLPAPFSDGMVLQRNARVPVWGWAAPGETVTLDASWPDGARLTATADEEGRWRLTLPTPEAGGPFTLRVEGENALVLEDVLVGEVWLASGQSNMEMKIARCARGMSDYEGERATRNHPRLRVFDVRNAISMAPEEDVVGTWRACTPESWPEFSAVAFYFGLALQEELDVPIGLITADWGGTPAEAWTSRATIARLPDFAPELERIDSRLAGESDSPSLEELRVAWWRGVDEKTPGAAGWSAAACDDRAWETATLPGLWESSPDLARFDGVVWYRRTVEIPAAWEGMDLSLALGPIDDMDTTWFDGERVGGYEVMGHWGTPRVYAVPGRLVRAGRHTIAVRVVDTGGAGGFSGRPEDLVLRPADDDDAAPLSLAGAWRLRIGAPTSALGAFPDSTWFDQGFPTSLFNGMIAPLVPYRIRGVIWYQGESNRGRAAQYRTLFPALIEDWRRHWGQEELPFYFVQIAPFRYDGDTGQAAELREAQLHTLSVVPHTGMAVTMDIGEPDDIHPANKWEVGRRLALWALAKDYGREGLAYSGPLYRGMAIEGARIRLFFDHTFGGLSTRVGPATHFAIAGEDRVFHPAQVEVEGETLVVWGADVGRPVAVRFAWGAADMPNLVNLSGLPASSFRTDHW